MRKRTSSRTLLILAPVLVFVLLLKIPTKYAVVLPGSAEDVLPMIHFRGRPASPSGHLYLTTVYVNKANLFLFLFGYFDPQAELIKESGLPANDNSIEKIMMRQSQINAEAVALRKAGYPIKLKGDGVRVVRVLRKDRAFVLRPGDVIAAVDGRPTPFVQSLLSYLLAVPPGEKVKLNVQRGKNDETILVATIPPPSGKGSKLGILVQENGLEISSPVSMKMDVGDIEGSSAGLMFSIGIYDLLLHGSLLNGKSIAGTGTIDFKGNVGPIEGIRQKMIAAKRVHAAYFLCPVGDYKEAVAHPEGLTVVPVKTFDEAVRFIQSLS